MLSGRVPNSAACTLDPAKRKDRGDQWASNDGTRRPPSVFINLRSRAPWSTASPYRLGRGCALHPRLLIFWGESNKYTQQKSHNVCTDPHTWIMIWFYPAFWWGARSLNSTDNEPREEDSRGAAGAWNEGTATVTEGMLILPTNTHIRERTHTHTWRTESHVYKSTDTYKNRHTSWEPLAEEEIWTLLRWDVFEIGEGKKKNSQSHLCELARMANKENRRPYMLPVILPTEADCSPLRHLALSI